MRQILVVAAVVALAVGAAPAAAEHRLGFGFHYWKTIDELVDDGSDAFDEIEDDGLSQVFSYQYVPGGLIKFEVDLEYFDKGFGGATGASWSPQVWVLAGSSIYGGVGVGVTYGKNEGFADWDEAEFSDPYYAARAGFDLLLLPRLHLDIGANYRFDAWSELEDADTDTLTLGAVARFAF
jgi:hypothetical protein